MNYAFSALLLGVLVSATTTANAIEFNQVQTEKSALTFVSKQMSVPVEGRFRSFRGRLAFDPAKPAAASAELEIDLVSIDAGSKDANDELAGKAWFNTKVFPVAKFVLTSVKPLGDNRFEVAGRMTIKGRTQDLTAPVTLRQEGNSATLEGSLVLKRADYAIGEGMWADFGTVANEVQVRYRLVATAAAK
ncbi:MAG: YceI family protein [Propionivibrio sp.]|uniref:YceI family protein n=1 Tax=Propionivibrio sp. TaxID=2212460 RepID=UPI001A373491|nr:YceI family protein [Propionivibrio sp.]MBL8415963.1 YceI family protein [Propionivibrio sp.]